VTTHCNQPTKPPVNTNKTTDESKEADDLTDDTNSIMETYNIPTANKFENLTKQDEPLMKTNKLKPTRIKQPMMNPLVVSNNQLNIKTTLEKIPKQPLPPPATSKTQMPPSALKATRRQTEHKQNNPSQMELETTLQMMQT
jgi:hypothetical protein